MASAQIDEATFEVRRSLRIEAPPERVWEALTTPAHIARWFGSRADFPDGVHEGALGTFGWPDSGDFPVRIESYDPPSTFAFTWGVPGEPLRSGNSTTATFTLTGDDAGTLLRVVESGFAELDGGLVSQRAAMADNAEGWTSELDELSAYVVSSL